MYNKNNHLLSNQLITHLERFMKETRSLSGFSVRVSDEALSRFCGQLASMLDAGIDIITALETISDEEKNSKFVRAMTTIIENIYRGNTFAQALEQADDVFSPFIVAMCRVGEQAGELPKILFNLEAYYNRRAEHRSHLLAVFLYPAVVFLLTAGVTFYLVRTVMPVLLESLSAMNRPVPPGVGILLTLNRIMTIVIPAIILFILFCIALERIFPDNSSAAAFFAQIKLNLPVVGELFYDREMALFSDAFGIMVASGVSILTALPIVCELLRNVWLKKSLSQTEALVENGKTLSESFKQVQSVDATFCQMVEVGEKSGTLEMNLEKGRLWYQKAYDKQFKLLSTALEPTVLIIVGIMVGLVVLGFMSILYAIYNGYASFM